MNRSFKHQLIVPSSAPSAPIIISTEDDYGKEIFRIDSNVMNIANFTGHHIHISISPSSGELIIREMLSDAGVRHQRAVSGHLTLVGGSYNVNNFNESLANGGLEAFFIRIVLGDIRLGKKSLELDTAQWIHTPQMQLHLSGHGKVLGKIKVVKIWIVNPTGNASFDVDTVRDALERGGALALKSMKAPVLAEEPTDAPVFAEKPTKPPLFTGYKDPDAVARADCVSALDYGEPPESSFSMKERQPQWVELGRELKYLGKPANCRTSSSSIDPASSEDAKWKDTRIAELEGQLKVQAVARENIELVNASLRHEKQVQDMAWRETRNNNAQLRQLIQSRDLMLARYNEEYVLHAQQDVSALATALAKLKGIARGDREGIKAGFPSVYVGQPTVGRLLENPFFVSNYLGPQHDTRQQKCKAQSCDEFDDASDDERSISDNNKRLKMH